MPWGIFHSFILSPVRVNQVTVMLSVRHITDVAMCCDSAGALLTQPIVPVDARICPEHVALAPFTVESNLTLASGLPWTVIPLVPEMKVIRLP